MWIWEELCLKICWGCGNLLEEVVGWYSCWMGESGWCFEIDGGKI